MTEVTNLREESQNLKEENSSDTAHSVWNSPLLPLVSINVRTVTDNLKTLKPLSLILGFLILLFYQTCDAVLTHFLETLFRSSEGTPNWVWFLAIFSVILNLVFPLLVMYWVLSHFKTRFSWKEFEQLLIEFLRAWGKTLNWTFLFILPGIWKWLSYTFVPFVVLFSKRYDKGELDALQQSSRLFRSALGKTLFLVLFFSVILPFVITTTFDEYREIWVTPVASTLVSLLEYIILILTAFISFQIFQKASIEVKDELVL